jgi:hypothetical protein
LYVRHPAIIRHGFVSAEEMAEIYGIPVSRVRMIEQLLLRSSQKKMSRSTGDSARMKKRITSGTTGKK